VGHTVANSREKENFFICAKKEDKMDRKELFFNCPILKNCYPSQLKEMEINGKI
jgi:hypothetical protein